MIDYWRAKYLPGVLQSLLASSLDSFIFMTFIPSGEGF